MIFKEYLTPIANQNIIKVKYPKLYIYLSNKYANHELLYDEEKFTYQLVALLTTYENVLTSIESSLRLREENALNLNNLGRVTKSVRKDIQSSNSDETQKYAGFQVVGDFEKVVGLNSSNRDLTNTQNEYNLYEQFIRLESIGNRVAWSNFEKAFIKLFITLYVLDI